MNPYQRFAAACAAADPAAFEAVLAADAVLVCDHGGLPGRPPDPGRGRAAVAGFLTSLLAGSHRPEATVEAVNGRPGVVLRAHGHATGVAGLSVHNGLIAGVWLVLNPDKLGRWHAAVSSGGAGRVGRMADGAPDTPSTARMIDYWLGGTDHFPIDVAAAQAFEGAYGPCADIFRSLRRYLGRTVAFASDHGIRDFLVFGAGIPSHGNVHEVVPEASVLYTDADPEIAAQGAALLADDDQAHYLQADATDAGLLTDERVGAYLPGWGSRPVALVFLGLAAFLTDDQLRTTLAALYDGVPEGSLLIVDFDGTELEAYPQALAMMGDGFHMRDPRDFPALLGRWRVGPEGIVPVARWRPAGDPEPVPDAFWGCVAVK